MQRRTMAKTKVDYGKLAKALATWEKSDEACANELRLDGSPNCAPAGMPRMPLVSATDAAKDAVNDHHKKTKALADACVAAEIEDGVIRPLRLFEQLLKWKPDPQEPGVPLACGASAAVWRAQAWASARSIRATIAAKSKQPVVLDPHRDPRCKWILRTLKREGAKLLKGLETLANRAHDSGEPNVPLRRTISTLLAAMAKTDPPMVKQTSPRGPWAAVQ
jgi:hypothetical protein